MSGPVELRPGALLEIDTEVRTLDGRRRRETWRARLVQWGGVSAAYAPGVLVGVDVEVCPAVWCLDVSEVVAQIASGRWRLVPGTGRAEPWWAGGGPCE